MATTDRQDKLKHGFVALTTDRHLTYQLSSLCTALLPHATCVWLPPQPQVRPHPGGPLRVDAAVNCGNALASWGEAVQEQSPAQTSATQAAGRGGPGPAALAQPAAGISGGGGMQVLQETCSLLVQAVACYEEGLALEEDASVGGGWKKGRGAGSSREMLMGVLCVRRLRVHLLQAPGSAPCQKNPCPSSPCHSVAAAVLTHRALALVLLRVQSNPVNV